MTSDAKNPSFDFMDLRRQSEERKRAEEALKKSERRFQRLVETNIIGMAVCDEETIVEINDAFLRMLGYTRGEMQPGELNWVELTPHEYLSQNAQALYEMRTTGAHTPYEKASGRRHDQAGRTGRAGCPASGNRKNRKGPIRTGSL